MSYIVWRPDFDLGIPVLDQHHHNLVALINDFHLSVNRGLDSELCSTIFSRLREYADYHFKVEEALMAHHGYPESPDHIAEHRLFVNNVGRLEKTFAQDPLLTQQVLQYLKQWLEQHILVIDRQLAEHIKAGQH
ncbi:MAG: hemerythrin family protein [Deltaproteobacteria bacterium]|nr:hemerythrin family protein [Deltaproteobacteria bacterium]